MPWVALGEFPTGKAAVAAVRALRARGFERLDAHTPFPVEGMREALGLGPSWVRWAALVGGAAGGVTGFLIQWWMLAWNWPIDVGDRPPNSWPPFILLTYEGVILIASFSVVFALLAAWRLPNLHHAALGAVGFESATGDGFWVSVEADELPECDAALEVLRAHGAARVQPVEQEER